MLIEQQGRIVVMHVHGPLQEHLLVFLVLALRGPLDHVHRLLPPQVQLDALWVLLVDLPFADLVVGFEHVLSVLLSDGAAVV